MTPGEQVALEKAQRTKKDLKDNQASKGSG